MSDRGGNENQDANAFMNQVYIKYNRISNCTYNSFWVLN